MYSIPGELIRSFFDASPLIEALSLVHSGHVFSISKYPSICSCSISLCLFLYRWAWSPPSHSIRVRHYVYPFCRLSNTHSFFHFPSPRTRRSGAALCLLSSLILHPASGRHPPAHSRPLWHRYFGQPFRIWVCHDCVGILPPQLWQEQARRLFPNGSTLPTRSLGRLQHVQKSIV